MIKKSFVVFGLILFMSSNLLLACNSCGCGTTARGFAKIDKAKKNKKECKTCGVIKKVGGQCKKCEVVYINTLDVDGNPVRMKFKVKDAVEVEKL